MIEIKNTNNFFPFSFPTFQCLEQAHFAQCKIFDDMIYIRGGGGEYKSACTETATPILLQCNIAILGSEIHATLDKLQC